MIVEVKLYGQSIGAAEWNDKTGHSTFQYNDKIINMITLRKMIYLILLKKVESKNPN